jgi:transcriptional regulator with XRE-family HTH domain
MAQLDEIGPIRRLVQRSEERREQHSAREPPIRRAIQNSAMPTRDRLVDRATRRTRRSTLVIGEEVRTARVIAGLSLAKVAQAVGMSAAQVSRLERGMVRHVDLVALDRVMATVGLDLSLRAYPAGPAIRDAAHVALLDRLRVRLDPGWHWRVEVPVGISGDPRAWDAVARCGGVSVAFAVETRLYDVQAQVRRAKAKWQIGGATRLIVVVSATRLNHTVLREVRSLLSGDLPLGTRAVMTALAAGRDPGANGLVVL